MNVSTTSRRIKRSTTILLAAVILMGVLTGAALAQGSYGLDWQAAASAGGHLEGGSYALDFTVGQAATGITQGGAYGLCSGFWCSVLSETGFRNLLPLIIK
jgi:hypothetical protein